VQSAKRGLSRPHAQALDEHLLDLCTFTHVAFTSKNGIAAVLQRLEELHGSPRAATEQLRFLSCWALGADAQLLEQREVAVRTPPQASTQGMVHELERRREAEGARILCPVPAVLDPLSEPPTVCTRSAAQLLQSCMVSTSATYPA
jgi:uroporphyrinogen-III synthase